MTKSTMSPKKICIAIDSFKGCLSSLEAGNAARDALQALYPSCEILRFPVSDGGEGMLEALTATPGWQGRLITAKAHDPLMRPIEAHYARSIDGKTAFIEMATTCGLPLLRPKERDPWITTTYGTGELIRMALDQGCRDFVIGIGGSATNDAGLGLLQALGFRFFDRQLRPLGFGGQVLEKVALIDDSLRHPAIDEATFTVACDVRNPFCGPQGAAYVFAPQKGADEAMVERLDHGLRSIARVIQAKTGIDLSNLPGAGAAGGLGGSLIAFLHATLRPGIDFLLDTLDFRRQLQGTDLVITGEGKADRQTLMGKVPYGILHAAKSADVPSIILVAGAVEDQEVLNQAGFTAVFSIQTAPASLQEAMDPQRAKSNLQKVITQIARLLH